MSRDARAIGLATCPFCLQQGRREPLIPLDARAGRCTLWVFGATAPDGSMCLRLASRAEIPLEAAQSSGVRRYRCGEGHRFGWSKDPVLTSQGPVLPDDTSALPLDADGSTASSKGEG